MRLRHVEHVMGTAVSFDVLLPSTGTDREAALAAACRVLHQADEVFSLWKPDSVVNRLRRGEITEAQCPEVVSEVVECCRRARDLSGGWFDPWSAPGGFDPTGLVKGWALQRAESALRRHGACAAMVNGGGDIACFGGPHPAQRWTVGIRHPLHDTKLVRVLELTDCAVATSGTYERGAHIFAPGTGAPVTASLASATVVGPDLAMADALATGLFAAGEDGIDAVVAAGYGAFVVRPDGSRKVAGPVPLLRAPAPAP